MFRIHGLGVKGLVFGVQSSKFRFESLVFRVQGLIGFRV